jgi:hypothetical protein
MVRRTMRLESTVLAMFLVVFSFSGAAGKPTPAEKMKPEDVLAKHLASIGTPEDVAAAKTRIMVGEVKARLKLSNSLREVGGPAQFASDGQKVLLAMAFNSTNYPYEKAGYDGDKITLAGLPTGGRSPLATFLGNQGAVLKYGLLGGTLSSAWALLHLDPKEVKLSYSGTEKINGREVHKLKFEPKKSDLKINLFFDAETFRHVRSDYSYTVSAYMGARPRASVEAGATPTGGVTRYQLIEEFSDFKQTGKLTLPHTYKLQLIVDAESRNLEWTNTFSQFVFDQAIEPESFNVAASPTGS